MTPPSHSRDGTDHLHALQADLAQRRHTEQTLRTTIERLRTLIDRSWDGITLMAADGTTLYSSPAASRGLGYQPEELVGTNAFDLSHPDERATNQERFAQLLQEPGGSVTVEFRLRHRDGSWRWLEAVATNLLHEPSVQAMVFNHRDITERKEAEAALRQAGAELEARVEQRTAELAQANEELRREVNERRRAEEELNRFFKLSLDMLCIAGFDGQFRRLNPAWEATLGWTCEEMLGRPYLDFVHPDDQKRTVLEAARLAGGEVTVSFENRYRCKDGSWKWLTWSARPHADRALIYAVARDSTERKKAQAALARSEQELRRQTRILHSILDSMADAVVVVDDQGEMLLCNASARLGMGSDDPGPMQEWDRLNLRMFQPDQVTPFPPDQMPIMRALRGESVDGIEMFVYSADHPEGTWASVNARPLRDDSGAFRGAVVVAHNVTQSKLAEDALRHAKESAEAASQAKSEFLAHMSHELRTPLNSVIGFANVLLKNKGHNLREQDLTYLQRILDNGKHLLSLINDVLDIAKVESGRMIAEVSPVSVSDVVTEVMQQLEGQVRSKQVRLRAELPPEATPLRTDAGKLKQVLINLIGNALKFTARGSVTVRLVVSPHSRRPRCIEVSDTGIGIAPGRLPTIFDAFQQADSSTTRKFGGTGLGLTISRSLCELLGYHIEVQSEVGKGSTFRVWLGPAPIPAAEKTAGRS
jgi:PAS domain S-box-containing protein